MSWADLGTLFGAGVLTFASPCILPLIPVYLGMLLGSSLQAVKEEGGRARLLTSTLAFTLGFGAVFTALGLGASALGGFLQAHRQTLLWVGGALIVLFGLKFLGVLRISFLEKERRFKMLRTGHRVLDASLFGVVFALGWTPCVGPILGSVLTYTASKTASPLQGAAYLAVYSAGIALPLLAVGFASDRLLPLLRRVQRHLPRIEKATGVVLVGVGLWLIASVAELPAMDPDVPPGPGVTADGVAIEPHIGTPSTTPRLVEFFTQSCPSCKKMEPNIQALKAECTGRRIEVIQIDAGDPRNRALVKRYKVQVVPTVSLLAPDGRELRRLVGERSLADLQQAAAGLIEETCGGADFVPLERLRQASQGTCGGGPAEGTPTGDLAPAPEAGCEEG